jgi:zinc protease
VFTDNTAETIAITVQEIDRIREEPVTTEELERARQYLALGFMRHFETTGEIAAHLAELALYDLPDSYLQQYPVRIAEVSSADVSAVAQRHLRPEQLAIVVVGDRARVHEPIEAIALGPIDVWEAE